MDIVCWPNPILVQVAEPVYVFDQELKDLVNNMFETTVQNNGLGLAAPQVGISKRIFVMNISGFKKAFINPKILSHDGEITYEEGCLSFPGITVPVKRHKTIEVEFQNVEGKTFTTILTTHNVREPFSVCFQHEYNHLEGVTFLDYLSNFEKKRMKKKLAT